MKMIILSAVLLGTVLWGMAVCLQQMSLMILAPQYCKSYWMDYVVWCSIPEKEKK